MLVTITTFQSFSEAKMAQERLENKGIYCFVADEQMAGFYPLGLGGFRLQVMETDIVTAKEILGLDHPSS
jgi:hypothetical protein